MTGYGKGEAEVNGRSLIVELKSVNHRFLDLSVKLPRALIFAEDTLKKTVSSRLSRGHLDVFTTYRAPVDTAALSLNESVVSRLNEIGSALEASFNIKNDLTASSVLRIPGVLEETPQEAPEADILFLVRTATERALDSLVKMREAEGALITKDILSKLDEVERLTRVIRDRAPFVAEEYKVRLKKTVSDALSGAPYDEARLLTEVALFADRAAIDEEITRLFTHVDHYRKILHEEPSAGRKLDFLTQELNREANTIGSKANDAVIQENVVLLKCEIEKIREQIQNLE